MITLEKIEDLTIPVITNIVETHEADELPRLLKLERYYRNQNDINNRLQADETKPNNKIANAYASYITDTLVGYFIGEPISYTCDENETLEKLIDLLEYNDEADENAELAKDASIFGVAYEYLYMSEVDNQLRFKRLDPKQTIPIYDKTVEENLLAVLRYFDDYDYVADEEVSMLEVITATDVSMFKKGSGGGSYEPVSSYPHYFNMVPVAIYENNEDETGDFEKVIPLIDAYDKMESDTLNDFEYFTDAYLALYGFTAEPEDITQMKQNRVILMDEGTSAEWLIKNSNDTSTENTKNRLDNNIHKFSKCPNMNDKEFAGNASGIAIKYKMLGTENLVSIKERKFKKGLQQRLELIAQITSLLGASFDWRSINIVFTRNIPTNDLELAQMVNYLKDIVSDETLLAQIPFVEDVQNELVKVTKEREQNKESSPFFNAAPDYKTKAMTAETEEVEE